MPHCTNRQRATLLLERILHIFACNENFTIMKHIILTAVALTALFQLRGAEPLSRLAVSACGHYLQYSDGRPFFYLGDTAWEIFHRLTREEADCYLADRAAKGFNVVQGVALAEFSGIDETNAYGRLPLKNRNPLEPDTDGVDSYWNHVDYIVDKANALGMYVGLLPTWGCHWNDGGAVFDERSAEAYGRFIAGRYGRRAVIWILGGDRNPDNEGKKAVIRAMAKGIRSVDKENLITFHPSGWNGSSTWFHGDAWLSFNGRQNSHTSRYASYDNTLKDYRLLPAKPVVDLEPLYEDHPVEFKPDEYGHSTATDVRRALYWDVFNGAAGVTYGHHSLWQMYDPEKGRDPVNRPLMTWREALGQPAAVQAGFLRKLMESRPYFSRTPAPDFIIPETPASAVPGAMGLYRAVATVGGDGSYAMVYSTSGRTLRVRGDMIKARKITVWLFNPRTGKARKLSVQRNDGSPLTLVPPEPNEATDWVWVIDDTSRRYAAPGKRSMK